MALYEGVLLYNACFNKSSRGIGRVQTYARAVKSTAFHVQLVGLIIGLVLWQLQIMLS